MEPDTRLIALRILIVTSLFLGGAWGVSAQLQPIPTAPDRQHGIELFNQHRFGEAARQLRQAVKHDAQDYQAWFYLGLALAKQNDLKNANKSLEQALKLRPNSAEAHNGLAYVYLLRNKQTDVISEAQAALRLDPSLAEPHYFLGVANLRMNSREKALAEADIAINLNPNFPAPYLLKSQALVSFFEEAVVLDPKVRSENRRERFREAALALEQFLKLEPNAEYRQTWIEQLESLRVYAEFRQPGTEGSDQSGTAVIQRVRVLTKPAAGYTEIARRNGTSGTVVLRAIFAADGKVKHILVVKGLPDGLSEQAVAAASKIKFIPASIDGKPAAMFMQLEYTFNLY